MNQPFASQDEDSRLSIAGVRSIAVTRPIDSPPDTARLLVTFISEGAMAAAFGVTSWSVSKHAPLTLEATMVIGSIGVPSVDRYFREWTLVVPGADEIWS